MVRWTSGQLWQAKTWSGHPNTHSAGVEEIELEEAEADDAQHDDEPADEDPYGYWDENGEYFEYPEDGEANPGGDEPALLDVGTDVDALLLASPAEKERAIVSCIPPPSAGSRFTRPRGRRAAP